MIRGKAFIVTAIVQIAALTWPLIAYSQTPGRAKAAPKTEQGPSEKDTIDWLNQNLKKTGKIYCLSANVYASESTRTELVIENGDLAMREFISKGGTGYEKKEESTLVSVLDRTKAANIVRVELASSSSGCTPEAAPNVVYVISCQAPACVVGAQNGTGLRIITEGNQDQQVVRSVTTALEHLLKLGGARKPLF